ncbi:MAG: Ig-like domain-containing protein, partial [Treponema sp.]|nr:Ig-like domain-containing protein [Treponema sp.]
MKKMIKPVWGICAGLLIAAGLIAGCEFSIDTMKVKSVKLPAESLAFPKYGERAISAIIVPEFAENLGVSWASDNLGIVEVTQGEGLEATLKGISAGQAVITVTTADGNKTASIQVTIEQPPVQTLIVRNMKAAPVTGGTTQGSCIYFLPQIKTDKIRNLQPERRKRQTNVDLNITFFPS